MQNEHRRLMVLVLVSPEAAAVVACVWKGWVLVLLMPDGHG